MITFAMTIPCATTPAATCDPELEAAVQQGVYKKSLRAQDGPTDYEKTDFWDSWVIQRPDGVLIRYVLAASRSNYLPNEVGSKISETLRTRVIEQDRHEFAYLRAFESRDQGKTWIDRGAVIQGEGVPIWTGGSIVNERGGITTFVTIPEPGNNFLQNIYKVESADGLTYGKPQPLFKATEIQRLADQTGVAYDFVSQRDGEVSACRDPFPFMYRGDPHLLIATKQVVDGVVKPAVGLLRFRDGKMEQVDVLPPLKIPELDLHPTATIQYEVPNVVEINGQFFLQVSVSYQLDGRFSRTVHSFQSSSLTGDWQPLANAKGMVFGPELATYGVGMTKLTNGKLGVQAFFNGYHAKHPVSPTEFRVVDPADLATLRFERPAEVQASEP